MNDDKFCEKWELCCDCKHFGNRWNNIKLLEYHFIFHTHSAISFTFPFPCSPSPVWINKFMNEKWKWNTSNRVAQSQKRMKSKCSSNMAQKFSHNRYVHIGYVRIHSTTLTQVKLLHIAFWYDAFQHPFVIGWTKSKFYSKHSHRIRLAFHNEKKKEKHSGCNDICFIFSFLLILFYFFFHFGFSFCILYYLRIKISM